jgi:hypothetical protein
MFIPLDDLDAAQVLLAAQEMTERQRAIDVEDLQLLARWAELHAADPMGAPGARRRWDNGGDRLVLVGGEGTPKVQELSLCELATARQVHLLRLRAMLADVLDLQHRLPRTWVVVKALGCDVWVARKVASLSRKLSEDVVHIVDAAVADAIAGESPGRVLELAEAKVIEADLAAHAARVETERRRRFVGLSKTNEHGLRHVIARIEAGDAVWIDAIVDRIADILASRPELRPDLPADLDGVSHDELRAVAFGWLARPEELAELLRSPDGPESASSETTSAKPRRPSQPKAVVYVHLHEAALAGAVGGVARVEDLGPMLYQQVTRLLGHADVDVTPVLDLADQTRVNAYEHPEAVKERAHLITVGEVFPHATRVSRKVDNDHPVPWDPDGPPGQTGDHNVAPLGRTHHRAKTHLPYRLRQLGPGKYLWTTPHGLHRHVDEAGTHVVDDLQANQLILGDALDLALEQIALEHGIALSS